MHSSRMRTVRSSGCISVSREGGCLVLGGLLGGGVWSGRVCSQGVCSGGGGCLVLGGCLLWGVSALGGRGSAPREVCSWGGGVCSQGGVCSKGVSQLALRQTPPPPCGQTDACKNITFATSLRTVITHPQEGHSLLTDP